eukprot:m.1332006 g.1332006  ORF g.1332006 m.1332006 type:complete len:123 (-) comp24868_c0_seq1:1432-1800(-)
MTTVSSCAAWNVGRYFETADPRLSSVSSEYTWDYRSSNCQQHTWCHLKGDWVTNNSEYRGIPTPSQWLDGPAFAEFRIPKGTVHTDKYVIARYNYHDNQLPKVCIGTGELKTPLPRNTTGTR